MRHNKRKIYFKINGSWANKGGGGDLYLGGLISGIIYSLGNGWASIGGGGLKTGGFKVGFYGNVFTKGRRRSITVRHNNVIERPRDKMDNANRFRTSKYHMKVPTWKYLLISIFKNLTIFNGLHRIKKEILYGIFLSLMLTVVDRWVFERSQ